MRTARGRQAARAQGGKREKLGPHFPKQSQLLLTVHVGRPPASSSLDENGTGEEMQISSDLSSTAANACSSIRNKRRHLPLRVGFESYEARAIRCTNSMTDAAQRKASCSRFPAASIGHLPAALNTHALRWRRRSAICRLVVLQNEAIYLSCPAQRTAGVEFIDENGGGPGVRLRKREKRKLVCTHYLPCPLNARARS